MAIRVRVQWAKRRRSNPHMPITQIPFQDPVAPPPKEPEQLGLYDAQGWETAYKAFDDDARVPHLLIQLQDDLARSRRREAAWISIITHLVLIILFVNFDWMEKHFPWLHSVVVVGQSNLQDKNVTFLTLPPDVQKVPHRPNTNIASDKDRIATSRHPELDPKELRKILATPPPGAPGMSGPRTPQEAPPASAQNAPAPQPPPPSQTAQLQIPARPIRQRVPRSMPAQCRRARPSNKQPRPPPPPRAPARAGGQRRFRVGHGSAWPSVWKP